MSLRRKAAFLLFASLVFLGSVVAEPNVEVDPGDKKIWLNEKAQDQTLNGSASCDKEIKSVKIETTFGSPQKTLYSGGNSSYDIGYELDDGELEAGDTYRISLSCDNGSARDQFKVEKLSMEIEEAASSEKYYYGTTEDIKLDFSTASGGISGSELDQIDRVEFYLDDQLVGYTSSISDPLTQTIEVKEDISDQDLNTSLEVVLKFDEDGQSLPWKIEESESALIEVWDIQRSYDPSRRLTRGSLSSLNVTLDIMKNGEAVDSLDARHFYIERGSDSADTGEYEWFSGGLQQVRSSDSRNYGVYNIRLQKTPTFDSEGGKEFDIMFESENLGPKKVGSVYVRDKFKFSGRVSDSDSRSVGTSFRLKDGSYVESFGTNGNGEFSRRIKPTSEDMSYGMDVSFPRGELSLSGTELKSTYSGKINYDYYENPSSVDGVSLKGVDPINMMAVSFGYPFDSGKATMEYNPAKAGDPMNVDVYECQRWNFYAEECISGWERLDENDVTSPPTSAKATFPLTPVETDEYDGGKKVLYSAYMVGTNSGLAVDSVGLDSYRFTTTEQFSANGRVVTKGEGVEDADVEVRLKDRAETVAMGTASTDSSGNFQVSFDTPKAGNYTVEVKATKGEYEAYTEELDQKIEVYRQKELSVQVKDDLNIVPGTTDTTEIVLNNIGKIPFEEGTIEVSESDVDVSISRESFSLEPGEKTTFNASVNVPYEKCDPGCAQVQVSKLKISADGFEEKISLEPEIVDSASASTSQADEEEQSNSSSSSRIPKTPVGSFIASQSSVNIALGLITVFSLALAGAVRKNKESDGRDGSESRQVNIHKPKVEPSESSDDEIDEMASSLGGSASEEEEPDAEDGEDDSDIDAIAQAFDDEEASDGEDEPVEDDREDERENEKDDSAEVEADEAEDESQEQEFVCDTCGEEFDTQSGLDLHEQALH